MKYKVGDKVRVKRQLDSKKTYDGLYPLGEMLDFAGAVVTIAKVCNCTYVIAEGKDHDPWWTDAMFTGLVKDAEPVPQPDQQEERKSPAFKVGDLVVGNKKATGRYTVTQEGWKGHVVEILGSGKIRVEGKWGNGISDFNVEPEYFDLLVEAEPTPELDPDLFELPWAEDEAWMELF